eukprot:gnl/MRDRNA2_/MRDRNA2_154099_c0_seq1.p1 gnl/MRDRNA2_/MRDRNA2_154099_c0~~gnl/MRDRNA2_/MRDRNA2_154099_c0_seq1.p1  ORF type:complete len:154 (-),score=24.85 gnl/MRDRNA2_/MRDRNA2_154099_c0_seq1:49-477(-)
MDILCRRPSFSLSIAVATIFCSMVSGSASNPVTRELPSNSPFSLGQMVRIYNVTNLPVGTLCKVMGFHTTDQRYIVRDGAAKFWGVTAEQASTLLSFEPSSEWQEFPADVAVPPGLEIKMDLSTGKRMARVLEGTCERGCKE